MTEQIPLNLSHEPSFEREDFIISGSNEAAAALINAWPNWTSHMVALVGPVASGKSHLGEIWRRQAKAVKLAADATMTDLEAGQNYILEDVDSGLYDEELLFHLYNWSKETHAQVLITAQKAPTLWDIKLPDLKSRLATLPVATIQEPDDQLLTALFIKLFSDRQLQIDASVTDYLIPRINRSFDTVKKCVDSLDKMALTGKRRITRSLAKACLERESVRLL